MPRAKTPTNESHETVLAQLNENQPTGEDGTEKKSLRRASTSSDAAAANRLSDQAELDTSSEGDDDFSAARAARDRVTRAAEAVRDRVENTVEDLGEAAASARDRAADVGSRASDAAADIYRELQHEIDRAYEAGYQRASYAYKRGRNEVGHFVRENPLTVCALGFAGGVILGALLPRTRMEDRAIGEYSDAAARRAREAAEDALRNGREAVRDTIDTASRRARDRVRSMSESIS